MADQRDAARERARDVLQQRAAAAAARAAPAAVATEPAPPPQPEPEDAEQLAPVLESPPPMPVPDPPAEDTEGSDTISGTVEVDNDGDSGSDTISSADVGYAVDLKFPETPPDGTESGPLDSEEPAPVEPEREEPLPPPAVLPTPAQAAPVANAADLPTSQGIDPAIPAQAADAGPILTAPARPTFVREVRLDPVRERLEAAAENIQLPGQSGSGLAAEVTQQADILRETDVGSGKRPGRALDDSDQGHEAGPLDVFAARFAAKHSADAGNAAFGPATAGGGAGRSRYGDEVERRSAGSVDEEAGASAEVIAAKPLPPGFRAGKSATDTGNQSGLARSDAPVELKVADPAARDAFEPDVDEWALHRTRLSLIDSSTHESTEYARDGQPHELPQAIEVPLEDDA